uniref:HMA domain-containing protein n=1 Tax=Populus trichocarpa TaxID=3694 RepID=A0A3N7F1V9_POPTR|eukprot:XP_002306997.3 uncharacterized protein LOC7494725 [Populus trichocarpa]
MSMCLSLFEKEKQMISSSPWKQKTRNLLYCLFHLLSCPPPLPLLYKSLTFPFCCIHSPAHRSICILSLFVSFPFYLIISRSLFYHHFQSEFFMETVELKVEMVGIHEKRLRKCLSKLKGIEKVEVDVSSQKVMVTGYVHRNKILKAIRRGGLKADFWSTQDELLSVYASASYGSLRFNNFNFF